MYNCLQVTDEGLADIARHLNHLEHVSVYGKHYVEIIICDGFKSILDLPR